MSHKSECLDAMTNSNLDDDTNPYCVAETCQGNVDIRKISFGREHLSQQIRSYIAGEISAIHFLVNIAPYSDDDDVAGDRTTNWVAEQFDTLIDRNSDNPAAWPHERWNFVQRILLLLESGYEIHTKIKRRWTWLQIPPAVAVVALICVLGHFGWIVTIWSGSTWIVAGIVSMGLFRFRCKLAEQQKQPFNPALSPFQTIAAVEDAMRRATHYKKIRAAKTRTDNSNRTRTRTRSFFPLTVSIILWFIFAPLVLVVQCLPILTDYDIATTPLTD